MLPRLSDSSSHSSPERADNIENQHIHHGLHHEPERSSELSTEAPHDSSDAPQLRMPDDAPISSRMPSENSGSTATSRLISNISTAHTLAEEQDVLDAHLYAHSGTKRTGKTSNAQSRIVDLDGNLQEFPNEILTHILSHCPPQTLNEVALVSRRFHSLVTTPHAWRGAFARYFPGSDSNFRNNSNLDVGQVVAQQRYFGRLSTLASWRSEYILRTNLLRALGRARPSGELITISRSEKNLNVAHLNYSSGINDPITHIDALVSKHPDRPQPKFMHGAAKEGTTTISWPSAGKNDGWGERDGWASREWEQLYPRDALYGLGSGPLIGVPNPLSVSSRYGTLTGEGIPGGRLWYRALDEQRGNLCGCTLPVVCRERGIPSLNATTESICSVWLSRTANLPDLSEGLVGILAGSSSGILTAYSLGTGYVNGRRLERREMTARWVLSPGVPIIAILVDEQYSEKRYRDRRIWSVVLNALGEVFYVTDLPKRRPFEGIEHLEEEVIYEQAWEMGRIIPWTLVESSRRVSRVDLYGSRNIDGSYSPRGSSDAMGLSMEQVTAETHEIEQFFHKMPSNFQGMCEGWDMRRRLEVDFAGCNDNSTGEGIVVFECGLNEGQRSAIKRYTRFVQKDSITPQATAPLSPVLQEALSLADDDLKDIPSWSFNSLPSRRGSSLSAASSAFGKFDTWRVSIFSFGGKRRPQLSTTALDCSKFSLLTISEDPLINLAGSNSSSPTSSPFNDKPAPIRAHEVPGQRARFVAAGTMTGAVYIWNIRAASSSSSEIVSTVEPLKVIYTESPQISCLAITSLYIVHGGNDGVVQAWDPLSSTKEPLRTINGKFSTRARHRIAQAEASQWGVGVNLFAAAGIWVDPEPTVLRGMVSVGGHLCYWSYNSEAAKQHKSSKRRTRRAERGHNHNGNAIRQRGIISAHDHIANERYLMEQEASADRKEQLRLSDRYGIDLLGSDATEEEIMAYAMLISEETAKQGDSGRHLVDPMSGYHNVERHSNAAISSLYVENDEGLAAAIQASFENAGNSPSLEPMSRPPYSVRYGKSRQSSSSVFADSSSRPEMDDIGFALQLSLAEENSRLEIERQDKHNQESEEYPSEWTSVVKGKGKARMQ